MWGERHPKDCPGKRMQRSLCVPAMVTKGRVQDDTLVSMVNIPEVGWVETIQLSSPPRSGQLSPDSPRTIAFEDLGDSSVLLSPNRVQAGRSQEVPEHGSLFHVSPVSPGFLMRPSSVAVQQPEAGLLLPLALDSFSDSVLGDPIAFAQCALIPGSDAPLTLPVYTMLCVGGGGVV